ncbi:MAG: manganese efflux pump [Clostridia bacterium]|nr:manganese efflux pump [Clostridia bacterium]
MSTIEVILTAIGLSMDAFAVSVCKGLGMRKINYKSAFVIAVFFGTFQAIMPLIGWFAGTRYEKYIEGVDHWVAFSLLVLIGGKMFYEAMKKEDIHEAASVCEESLNIKELFFLAVATSIDALAVGITFSLLPNTNMFHAIIIIGTITFCLSLTGIFTGNKFGAKYKSRAEIAGGFILIGIGFKILLESLF